MATSSKKGACSANVQPAKANCLQHARREGKVPSYVNPHLTATNRTVFEDELIRGRKSIIPLKNQAEKLYTEKTGQKCQKSFTPFREDVLHIKAGVTDEQLMQFKAKAEELTGWKVVGIWLHQDEGHVHSKYIEGDEDFAINYHAHVLYDCQNHETGKAIRLGRDYFRKRQDVLAECTGMERGNPASETGRKHRSAMQQRIIAQEERLDELERQARLKEKQHQEEVQRIEGEKKKLQDEVDNLKVWKAGKEKALGLLGQSSKDKTIKEQAATIETLQGQIKAVQRDLTTERGKSKETEEKAAERVRNAVKTQQDKIALVQNMAPKGLYYEDASKKAIQLAKEGKLQFEWLAGFAPSFTADGEKFQEETFDPLCIEEGAHDGETVESCRNNRKRVAQKLVFWCINALNKAQLIQLSKSLNAMSTRYWNNSLPKNDYELMQRERQAQREAQQQDREESRGIHRHP